MSTYNYPESKAIWDYVKLQRNANQIGPLGIRAGLDITELYTAMPTLHKIEIISLYKIENMFFSK